MIAGEVDALAADAPIDVLLVNARPASWLSWAPVLDCCLVDGGEVLCSGMLATEADDVIAAVADLGWRSFSSVDENDWLALRFRVDRATIKPISSEGRRGGRQGRPAP